MQFLIDNKEWLFSGLGIFVITIIFHLFRRKDTSIKQTQKSGKKSTNYQSGGNMTIGTPDDK